MPGFLSFPILKWSFGSRPSTSARAIADVGANVFARGFRSCPERNLSQQFGVPLLVRSSDHKFMIGDKQIRTDIVHGRSPLVEDVRSVEVMPGGGPQSLASLPKLTGCRPEIALQAFRDPGD